MNLRHLKISALAICLLGSALVAYAALQIRELSGWFAVAAVLPVLVPLPALLLLSRKGQAWVCIGLIVGASFASYFQYQSALKSVSPFMSLTIWAYPLASSVVVLVLLTLGLVLTTHFQFRRGEV